jgi:peptide/nickel transport system substrate-binding protein
VAPDFRTHVLWLRPGVRFHDGREFTSRDVAFTFESVARGEFAKSANFHALERVETPDPLTARFVSRVSNPGLLVDLVAVGILPEGSSPDPHSMPIGTGPFHVAMFDRDGEMRLDAFDGYFAGRPVAEGIDIHVLADAVSREAALTAGEIDVAINTYFTPESLARLGAPERSTRVQSSPGGAVHYVALNVEKGPLADTRVRRALAHAINRLEIIDALFGGRAQLASGPLPPNHWAAASMAPTHFDPDMARHLVHEALGGAEVTVEILTPTGPADIMLASVFQESWRRIGVNAHVTSAEPAVFFDRLTYGDFAAGLHRFTGGNQFTTIFKGAFHSRAVHFRDRGGGEINYARFSDSETDALIDRADVSSDRAERLALYAEIQRRIASAAPWIPLWHPDNIAVLGPRVGALDLNSGGDFYCLRGGPLASPYSP